LEETRETEKSKKLEYTLPCCEPIHVLIMGNRRTVGMKRWFVKLGQIYQSTCK